MRIGTTKHFDFMNVQPLNTSLFISSMLNRSLCLLTLHLSFSNNFFNDFKSIVAQLGLLSKGVQTNI